MNMYFSQFNQQLKMVQDIEDWYQKLYNGTIKILIKQNSFVSDQESCQPNKTENHLLHTVGEAYVEINTKIQDQIDCCSQRACKPFFLNFHMIITIILVMGKLKIWAPQEDDILVKVSNAIKSKKWKKASEELHKAGFERTDVECRQRYINHLDPTVNKELWSEQELQTLYSKYSEYGNKWFLLQKHLPGRTQTKIKNYFYGTIRFFLKIIIKYFCKKNTGFVNDIKTDTLLEMYQAKNSFQQFQIINKTIKKLKFKVQKRTCEKLIRQNQDQFYNFTQHFLGKYAEKNNEENSNSQQSSKQQIYTPQIIKIQCFPIKPTQVEIVSSSDSQSNLEAIKALAMNHFRWYEYYQNAYDTLMGKKDQTQ